MVIYGYKCKGLVERFTRFIKFCLFSDNLANLISEELVQ